MEELIKHLELTYNSIISKNTLDYSSDYFIDFSVLKHLPLNSLEILPISSIDAYYDKITNEVNQSKKLKLIKRIVRIAERNILKIFKEKLKKIDKNEIRVGNISLTSKNISKETLFLKRIFKRCRNKEFHNEIISPLHIIFENIINIINILENKYIPVNTRIQPILDATKILDEKFNLIRHIFDTTLSSDNTRNEIVDLTNKLKKLEKQTTKDKTLLQSEKLEKERVISELKIKDELLAKKLENEKEQELKDIELKKIKKAIDKIDTTCKVIEEEQNTFKVNRDSFKKYALDFFTIAGIIFIVMTLYLNFGTDIHKVDKKISLGYYLIHSFPVLFPTILGFLFIRQSNINAQELNKINRRFVLTHDVKNSLEALVEINDVSNMHGKAEKIIDKLIDNILDYANENNSNTSESRDLDILELNEKIDKIIDTLDKKKTVFNV